MDENLDTIRRELKKYSQEHLLNEYERLDSVKQKQLLEQIENTDFELINSLYNNTKKEKKKLVFLVSLTFNIKWTAT